MPSEPRAEPTPTVIGLLLAAGAGRRMGGPKALLVDGAGRTLVSRAVRVLRDGGCARVVVVTGAASDRVVAAVGVDDPRVTTVAATDWAAGQGASLRTGLSAITADPDAVAALVMLVDLPGVGRGAIQRLASRAEPGSLARATYHGRPGHPVLLGRDHWAPILAELDPAAGAKRYLRSHPTADVPCDDLADGSDLDEPADAARLGFGPTANPNPPMITNRE